MLASRSVQVYVIGREFFKAIFPRIRYVSTAGNLVKPINAVKKYVNQTNTRTFHSTSSFKCTSSTLANRLLYERWLITIGGSIQNNKHLCRNFSGNVKSEVSDQLATKMRLGKVDPNSYAESEKITTTHISLEWDVDFDKHILKGSATYNFKLIEYCVQNILLDVRDIKIHDVVVLANKSEIPINFFITDCVENIGSKLTLELPQGTCESISVRITYETSPNASALQWLTPEQTLGKQHPYLFSQCQAIHARSLLPCQDTPSVKFTYTAKVTYPPQLTALMSAICVSNGDMSSMFEQKVPIPSYLLAIAVGKLVSRRLGPNSKVWAEEGIIEECAAEFTDTPKMLETAAEICGPYVWGQYDLLVMPPSFPYGGMENPCLTFVTPTLLAGDKSLVDVVAHEIAHSWTGNLVTNKNFEHFWMNEGFTVFVEGKIVGRLKGDKERDFHAIMQLTDLQENIKTQLSGTSELTKLIVDLSDLSPDDAFSSVPYVKGSTFLRYLEDTLGGPTVFEPFLRFYLNKYQYKSVLTDDFKSTMYDYYSQSSLSEKLKLIDWDKWLYSEGMPLIIPQFDDTLAKVSKNLAHIWGSKPYEELKNLPEINQSISSHQLIDFLSKLIENENIVELHEPKILLLESVYNLNKVKNAEVRFRFIRLCIRARLMERMDEIIAFANSNFRMKYVRPIYRDLAGWPEAKPIAIENFNKVKNQMMAVCKYAIEKDLGLNKSE